MKRTSSEKKFGLARVLSKLGYCSRSQAVKLIQAGRVSLNGRVQRDPETPVSRNRDTIAVDEKAIKAESRIYVVMNKPRGVVTTASDEHGRDTVYTILNAQLGGAVPTGNCQPWLAPVGRLDKASEGLLLMTNDSEWAATVAAPESHLDKTYHVQIAAVADEEFVQTLRRGVRTLEGEVLRAKHVRLLRAGRKHCWLEIVLDEGKNRQIRRMVESLGVEVLRLIRVAIGPLQLGDLGKGEVRPLSAEEKRLFDAARREAIS